MILTKTQRLAAAIASTGLMFGLVVTTSQAGTMQANSYDYIHRRMANESTYDSVVSLDIVGGTTNSASAVIIGGRYLVTAAHNVDEAADIFVNVRGDTIRASRWVVNVNHYNWDFSEVNRNRQSDDYNPFPNMINRGFEEGNDIAIIELSKRIPQARNMKAKLSRNVNQATGKTGTIVGFGQAGSGALGIDPTSLPGIKRAGTNKIDNVNRAIGGQLSVDFDADPNLYRTLQTDAGVLLPPSLYDTFTGEYHIEPDDIPLAQEYMPAVGDSGGGLFINGNTLAGITSWSSRSNSEYFSQAYFTTIAKHYNWIRDNIKALKGRQDFRGNLDVWQEIEGADPGPRYFKVSDFGAPGFALIPERADRMGDDLDGDNVFGFVFSDPYSFSGALGYQTPGSVPEPASLALLTLGGLAMIRRTRR
ncbi:MAG: trypsin-like serine protease [Phycisphaerales bacterium]